MRNRLHDGNRRLLFRSYLVLVGGLLSVALLLDFGFSRLQTRGEPEPDRWLTSTLQLVEQRLAVATPDERVAIAADLAEELGVGVQLLARDDVHRVPAAPGRLPALVDSDGNTSWLYDAESIDAIIRLGPVATPGDSLLLNLLPPLFYLSILVVVGLWLRPLLRDIDVISRGAQRFAADYREPPAMAGATTELTSLAQNLDEMAAKLSGVLRSQKELIAALSHEMRTPLARIRFALAVVDDQAGEELRQKLRAMNDDVQEIDDLVSAMLNYARLDHPELEMHWQAVPIDNWMGKVVDKTPHESIRIEARSDAAPDTVGMDPHLMELALSNLLVNAARYARSEVRCTALADGGDCVLSIEDDGQGIPEHERDNVFSAFTRLDDSRNRDTGGYGLGLAVVARVAELHGGETTVDSSPALGGARFRLRWPAGATRGGRNEDQRMEQRGPG